jgi:hypothetical protein
MNVLKKSALAACVGVLGLAIVPNSRADVWNKKTILTVNEAIQVPGQVLQPGKYVMRLMDSPSNRHIVQVFNEDETQLLTTVLALPNYRLQPTGDTTFTFWETVAGEPKPLRSWFYPGDNFGQEFAYPKDKATSIAKASGESVPTTYSTSSSDLATARVGAVDAEGVEGELDKGTYTAPDANAQTQAQTTPPAQPETQAQTETQTQAQAQPEPEPQQEQQETTIAQATPQQEIPARTPAADNQADRMQEPPMAQTLPETASPLPLIGLLGLFSLGAGFAVRAMSRR